MLWIFFSILSEDSLIDRQIKFNHNQGNTVCKHEFICVSLICFVVSGGHHQDAKVRVNIKVKDVNDNAPEFATQSEVFVCENVNPGKVSHCVCIHFTCLFYYNSLIRFLIKKLFQLPKKRKPPNCYRKRELAHS